MAPFRETLNHYGPVVLVLIAGLFAAFGMYDRGLTSGYEQAIHNNGLDSVAHFDLNGTLTLPPGATANVDIVIDPVARQAKQLVQIGGGWLPMPGGVYGFDRLMAPTDTVEEVEPPPGVNQ